MATKMLRMVVLLVYARSPALHTTSSASTCYAFRCSQCGASTPHTSKAHTSTHVCNAVCQCHKRTHTHATRLCEKSALICYRTEKTSNTDSAASPQEEEIPCQMASKAVQASTLTKHLWARGLGKEGEREVQYWRREERKVSDKQEAERQIRFFIQYLPLCGENRGFAEGLEEALLLISSTCF